MKKITACAAVIFLGLAGHALAAELAVKQWSVLLPEHIAIPEKFGAPIRERFGESDTTLRPEAQTPVSDPARKPLPSPADAAEWE
jgi:hypothetical protein